MTLSKLITDKTVEWWADLEMFAHDRELTVDYALEEFVIDGELTEA